LRPHIFILNDDDSAIPQKKKLCDKIGTEIVLVKRTVPKIIKATSSTEILEKINRL
jgi:hypothetical protein